ncbi:helix-turn-helix domain-containing protein [Lentzea sp. NEAU-D7]|uniref:helix-turn-helix domain-containing protein n=1 Tax=Lentzea sp. NEAU-D7 TaxID=2994667 RepID=UPI00224B9455|nr:helix-turn-helix transcriptional regulator [Lentzea sp. NEAU-D7]MCX2953060.1 helix-turn-helix transcriptional regulator [Lentzea sp. NEAU-D7]
MNSPVVLQKRLLDELRQMRDDLELTQQAVADALDWSVSKLIRVEKGENKVSVTDVQALLFHYGVTDKARVDELVGMARAIKRSRSAWMDKYKGFFSEQFARFLELETSAVRIRQCQLNVVPGLLQISDYARVLVAANAPNEDSVARGVEIRLHRQSVLEAGGPEIFIIMDEAVLHRVIGTEDVLRRQLVRIKEIAALPHVTIQILPFAKGIHPAMKNSFSILDFSEDENDFALLIEQPYKDTLFTTGPEMKEYLSYFYQLEKFALPASETPNVIDRRLEELGGV